MKTAELINDIWFGTSIHRKLYKLSEPVEYGSYKTAYLSISASTVGHIPQTHVFPCDDMGNLHFKSWGLAWELNGLIGVLDHEKALANIGYQVGYLDSSDEEPTNNYTCLLCKNNRCSKREKACWWCGTPIPR